MIPRLRTLVRAHKRDSGNRCGNSPDRHPLAVFAAAAVAIAASISAHAAPEPHSEPAIPVGAVRVQRSTLVRQLVLQGEFRPYQEIDLHSKIAGFLATLNVDIGDVVTAGQVIGTIEVPELEQDLRRGMAMERRAEQEVNRAEVTARDTHLSLTRLAAVNESRPNLIAQQDLDNAKNKDDISAASLGAAKEQVEVAKEEVNRLRTMLDYSKITAPFAGVITKRYADRGAMIPAGTASSTQTMPVVRLSENGRLRFVFSVSMPFVSQMQPGVPVEIRIEGRTNTIIGKIARSARKVEFNTRTMDVEADVPNTDLSIIPGMYATAAIPIEKRENALAVPVEAVTRAKSNSAYVVNSENRVEERTLVLGMETPSRAEVISGLKENEWVVIGAGGKVRPGQLVEPKPLETSGTP